MFFQFEIIINVFLIHLNTYVMGLRPIYIFVLLQMLESDVYRRQILTTKVYPRTVMVKIFSRNCSDLLLVQHYGLIRYCVIPVHFTLFPVQISQK